VPNNPRSDPHADEETRRKHRELADRVAELQRQHDELEQQRPVNIADHEAHIARLRELRADLQEHRVELEKMGHSDSSGTTA